jgi:pilus assembly protein CpaE
MIATFFGTKGGTGTTTLAVNCAADMRRLSGRSTLIVDAKQAPGDVAVFLGMRPRYGVTDLIDQAGWTEPALAGHFIAQHGCGLHVLAASEAFGRPSSRDADGVDQALRCLSAVYENVAVDAGSALTSSAAAALTASDIVMLVANPDVPCLRNLPRLSDALRFAGVAPECIRIVLNRTSDNGALQVSQIERALGRTIDFQVMSDYRTVAAAMNSGVPVSSERAGALSAQFDAIARALLGPALATV